MSSRPAAEQLLQAVVDELMTAAPIAISILDAEFRFVRVNLAAASINGLPTAAHIGQPWDAIVPDVARAYTPRLREALLQRRPILNDEVSGSTAAEPGRVRWWRVDWLPVWRDEAPAGIVALFTEITEQKQQAERARLDEDAARSVAATAREAERDALARAERAHQQLAALHSVTDAGLASLDVDALLAEMLPRVRDAVDAASVAVLLAGDGDALTVRHTIGPERHLDLGVVEKVARSREAVVLSTVHGIPGLASLAAVPLLTGNRLVGVLQVGHEQHHTYDDDEVRLLTAAAERVALALDRATTYEQQRHVAETLQRSLLPAVLPDLPDVRLVARYEAGDEALTVGGDWYDALLVSDDRVALLIGDVMGHGISAAASMGRLRTELRAYLSAGDRPHEALTKLNRSLCQDVEEELATACIAVLDRRTGALEICNAGHPPPVLVSRSGAAAVLSAALGPPLGVLDGFAYRTTVNALRTSEALLLYTDGLVERRGSDIDSGVQHLVSLLTSGDGDSALATAFAERDRSDDGAALLVERVGELGADAEGTPPSPLAAG